MLILEKKIGIMTSASTLRNWKEKRKIEPPNKQNKGSNQIERKSMKYRNKNQRKSWFFKKTTKIDRLSNHIDQEKRRYKITDTKIEAGAILALDSTEY